MMYWYGYWAMSTRSPPIDVALYQVYGDFQLIDEQNEDIFAFKRSLDKRCAVIVLNFTDRNVTFTFPQEEIDRISKDGVEEMALLLSNCTPTDGITVLNAIEKRPISLELSGYEGRIYL